MQAQKMYKMFKGYSACSPAPPTLLPCGWFMCVKPCTPPSTHGGGGKTPTPQPRSIRWVSGALVYGCNRTTGRWRHSATRRVSPDCQGNAELRRVTSPGSSLDIRVGEEGRATTRRRPPEVIRDNCTRWTSVRGPGGWIWGDVGAAGTVWVVWGGRWGACPGVEGNGPHRPSPARRI